MRALASGMRRVNQAASRQLIQQQMRIDEFLFRRGLALTTPRLIDDHPHSQCIKNVPLKHPLQAGQTLTR